jgi:hypothetical protein
MTKIKDWKARRAGGRITITGIDADTDGGGHPVKIVGVNVIEAGASGKPPTATDRNGETYELV